MKLLILFSTFLLVSYGGFCQQQNSNRTNVNSPLKPYRNDSLPKEMRKQQEDRNKTIRMDRSKKIADKMVDSLGLSQAQRADIININASLEQQKMQAFKSDTSRANIGMELQRLEKQRDNLYKTVLTEQQFKIYSKSKMNLINPNGPKKN